MSRSNGATAVAEAASIPLQRLAGVEIPTPDRVLYVGALNLNELLALSQVFATVVGGISFDNAKKAKALLISDGDVTVLDDADAKKAQDAATGDVIQQLMTALQPQSFREALSIITRQPADWCGEALDLDSLGLIVEALLAHNDPKRLIHAFRQAASKWSPPKPAEPSPQPA